MSMPRYLPSSDLSAKWMSFSFSMRDPASLQIGMQIAPRSLTLVLVHIALSCTSIQDVLEAMEVMAKQKGLKLPPIDYTNIGTKTMSVFKDEKVTVIHAMRTCNRLILHFSGLLCSCPCLLALCGEHALQVRGRVPFCRCLTRCLLSRSDFDPRTASWADFK